MLIHAIRSSARYCSMPSFLNQQANRLNRLTPISCHLHFHQNKHENIKRTGFKLEASPIMHKSIHSHSALYFQYSNLLDQKVKENVKKIDNDENKSEAEKAVEALEEGKKLGLFARFKKMAKDYWYVLIPVHVVTSCFWFGSFYYASMSGVNIVGLLEYYEFSETIIKPLRDSKLGHIAVAYFLYKVATPARYTVTVGGTTFAIKFLSHRGIIKPMPSRDKLVQIYKDKKDDIQEKIADKKQALQDKKQVFQDKFMKKD
ncbi:CLUMA_CG018903, isoform A [Clunio marinus]|uniref:CLUMA_CG018903, isoform A n=1 Tax=Clunio marinus TaxID=568069 RepID=A0A1J1J1N7_9DIPT|nr:CLUMA_CG018903, isoform A [Clunio marinus]